MNRDREIKEIAKILINTADYTITIYSSFVFGFFATSLGIGIAYGGIYGLYRGCFAIYNFLFKKNVNKLKNWWTCSIILFIDEWTTNN